MGFGRACGVHRAAGYFGEPVKTVLICGGRDYTDRAMMRATMETWLCPGDTIIHGGAPGADTLAAGVAKEMGIEQKGYPADWRKHGKAAGPIRNQLMLDDGKPDIVVAFPGGKGTADMIRRATGRVLIVTVA